MASSMRRCQAPSGLPVREPAASKSLTYCGRGMLPTTVVGKSGSELAIVRHLGAGTQRATRVDGSSSAGDVPRNLRPRKETPPGESWALGSAQLVAVLGCGATRTVL